MGKEFFRKANRLKFYDYSSSGWYFITICTSKLQHLFGEIVNGNIILNESGKIVKKCLFKIPFINDSIALDHFVIMPNHIHVILIQDVADANLASKNLDRSKMILSKTLQQFKRACTIEIKRNNINIKLVWQRSFYDRVIRSEMELYQIRKYIEQNSFKSSIKDTI